MGRERVGKTFAVFLRLDFDAGQREALFLCFDDSCSFAIYIQEIVGESVPTGEREISQRDASESAYIG